MKISTEDLRAVRQSFDQLRDELSLHSDYFYAALFRRAPQFQRKYRLISTAPKVCTSLTPLSLSVLRPSSARGLANKPVAAALYFSKHICHRHCAHPQQIADPWGGPTMAGRLRRC